MATHSSSSAAGLASKTLTLKLLPKPAIFLAFSSSTSSPAAPSSVPPPAADLPPESADRRPLRGEHGKPPEKLDETICRMMFRRPWTTRLQNSICCLVPVFDQPLVLAVLRRSGEREAERSLRFFRWVEKTGFRHDPQTYAEIISILTRASMINHARCLLLDDMPKRLVSPDEHMFAALIDAYGRAGIPQEAVRIFNRLPELGIERSVLSYDVFFKAILRRGRVLMAKRVFNSMIRAGLRPAISTYNILIWGFCLSSKMETANRFFADMRERGLSPNVITYNTLLNGWVRATKMGEAQKVFDEMISASLVPNSVTYNLMIKGHVSSGNVDDGIRLFADMKSKELKVSERTYAALMPGLCDDQRRAPEALKVLEEMAEHKMTPKDNSIFLRLIASMCKAGDLDGALNVHDSMGSFQVPLDSLHYSMLIEGLCNGGRYEQAMEMLDELLEKGILLGLDSLPLNPSAYNPMIEYLSIHGYTSKAEVLFRQLMKRGVDDMVAVNHLIRGHAKEGNPEPSFEIMKIAARRGVVQLDADAYEILVNSFLKKGEPADARTVLDSMVEQGHLPSPALFRSVMAALVDDDRVQTASRVAKTMVEKGVKENADVIQKILEGLLVRGHVEEAIGRIDLMIANGCVPDLDSLVVSLCDNDKPIAALKLVDFTLERDYDVSFSSYDRLLDALYIADKILPAYSILCKIKAKGGVIDKKGCEALIKTLNSQGHTKQADILSRILSGNATLEARRTKKKKAAEAY
ncbi:Pentatricopeptide repeat-containing protein [Apostasia shenzhenica]|uniref:Pentatricopeptide repeat-containing protein n=1 Tax=Apostasia shenzhenica TaxID=1088818 RepID=A0A2I0ABW3_9ASPA|nr:Pentatricopeptide repeat-containing protein [Apostasia shenzhenica]